MVIIEEKSKKIFYEKYMFIKDKVDFYMKKVNES